MAARTPAGMNVFELALPQKEARPGKAAAREESEGAQGAAVETAALTESALLKNALWFCRVRWVAAALLLGLGACCLSAEARNFLALREAPGHWPFVLAVVLALANAAFWAHARFLETRRNPRSAAANLWAQIILDLLVLTAAVHYCGSLETFLPFAYMVHIVLACVFFPKSRSLIVTGIATALYVSAVLLEGTRVWPPGSLFADRTLRSHMDAAAGVWLLNVAAAVTVWIVVWHLTSHLAGSLRRRENELAQANRRLIQLQEEKTRDMIRTAHELKAPFAGMYANTQVLLKGYCGELPEAAREVLERILARSRRLASAIQEMLQLANLRSKTTGDLQFAEHDLAHLLKDCIAQAEQVAAAHGVTIHARLQPARVSGVEEHLRMMLSNLVHNAVLYSRNGGIVEVECGCDGEGDAGRRDTRPGAESGGVTPAGPPPCAAAVIEDHGIGIPAEKLPHIFDEYYRTEEAVRHNPESTGLGLAIVRRVAETHGIKVQVASAPGVGTRFTLRFPGPPGHTFDKLRAVSHVERQDTRDGG